MATLRDRAKAAVKKARAATESMWIEVVISNLASNRYQPGPRSSIDRRTIDTVVRGVEEDYKESEIDGNRVQSGDRTFYFDYDDLSEVQLKGNASIAGVKHEIVSYWPIQQDVLWKVQFRRGG